MAGEGNPGQKVTPQKPDFDGAKRNIQKVLGGEKGSVGASLTEGLDAVKGVVDAQLDDLRADARGAKEAATDAGKQVEEARDLLHEAGEKVVAAQAAVHDNNTAIEAFIGEERTLAGEIRTNTEEAKGAAQKSQDAAERTETLARDIKSTIDTVSISVVVKGKQETLTGEKALEKINEIVGALAALSMKYGQSDVSGTEALQTLLSNVSGLELKRGKSTITGVDALSEIVTGIGSLSVNREGPGPNGQDGKPTTVKERITGFEALEFICAQIENAQDAGAFATRVQGALESLFTATVSVKTGDKVENVEMKGVALLGHIVGALEKIKFDLPDMTRKAVEDVFVLKVNEPGQADIELRGPALADFLFSEVRTAKTSAGSAVRQAEEAKAAAQRAEGLLGAAQKAAEGAQAAVTKVEGQLAALPKAIADGFAAVDAKLDLFAKFLKGEITLEVLLSPDVSALIAEPSFKNPVTAAPVEGRTETIAQGLAVKDTPVDLSKG
ncbi:Uncharacterised protein [Candidatus Bilamarchaeum dharawalense]|uniref:Uncharacterized protein n=1 Tax=Candidatus Bilamarchaeum dharawalense TaxID=2885759 RepID=A0A5E4LRD8_9ARCH|nr:Uncharacterised protein [Candidatus Bilamarchaeum dharawalense]